MVNEFINFVNNNKLGDINQNVEFKDITTLKIGGPIKCLYIPKDENSLVISLDYLKKISVEYIIVGAGSNILASDEVHDEVVIKLDRLNKITKIDDFSFYVDAGLKTSSFSVKMAKEGYTNHEFLAMIPGTIGGAIYMNAGANGNEIKDILKSVTYIEDGKIYKKNISSILFDYRFSEFMNSKNVILGALFNLKKSSPEKSIELIRTYKEYRIKYQPNHLTAGSTFKNKKEITAGNIIDKCELKGFRVNGAMVSYKHANFIINYDYATFSDMMNLINHIKKIVFERTNINLELEWVIIE